MTETTTVGLYRKRPVQVQAMRYDEANPEPLLHWLRNNAADYRFSSDGALVIGTLEGYLRVVSGAWVIRGLIGEFYPCDPYVFAETYEAVEGAL